MITFLNCLLKHTSQLKVKISFSLLHIFFFISDFHFWKWSRNLIQTLVKCFNISKTKPVDHWLPAVKINCQVLGIMVHTEWIEKVLCYVKSYFENSLTVINNSGNSLLISYHTDIKEIQQSTVMTCDMWTKGTNILSLL